VLTGLPSLLVHGCGWSQGWSSGLWWLTQFEPLWPFRRLSASVCSSAVPFLQRIASCTWFDLIMTSENPNYQADDILIFLLELRGVGAHFRRQGRAGTEPYHFPKLYTARSTRLIHLVVASTSRSRFFKFGWCDDYFGRWILCNGASKRPKFTM
jgi:hypothetical protein